MDTRQELNSEQKRAVDLVINGSNLFLTGSAGTGKSFVLRYIVEALRALNKQVVVTATTGIAAVTIGGLTIHSFAGFGIGDESKDELRRKVSGSKRFREIWQSVDVLIIDEISMLKPDYFEKLSIVAQAARQDTTPMGGVQLVLVGDFFQLPPVREKHRAAFSSSHISSSSSSSSSDEKKQDQTPIEFCFQTKLWQDVIHDVVELKQVFRQSDPGFVKCLQRIREGLISADDIRTLTSRLHANVEKSGIKPTFLHSRTDEVNRINKEQLDSINQPPKDYHLIDGFHAPKEESAETLPPKNRIDKVVAELKKNVPADHQLTLKVGAQVMLLANLSFEHHLVNGSRGVVVRFTETEPIYPIVRFAKVEATIRAHMWKYQFRRGVYAYVAQIPLKLAYAYTMHKSQSQSIDCVQIQLDKSVFAEGQAYTALSRVSSLNGLTLSSFDPSCIRANPLVKQFYLRLHQSSTSVKQLLSQVASANKLDGKKDEESDDNEEDEIDEESDENEEIVEEEDDEDAEEEEEEEVIVEEEDDMDVND